MDNKTVWVLNGPNLNLLGERQPAIYGHESFSALEGMCAEAAERVGLALDFRQSNHEGTLIDWVQEARHDSAGIVINAGGYTHTSIALRDALATATVFKVEVHISDIHAREEYRRHSFLSEVCDRVIIGHGIAGYGEAITWIGGNPPSPPAS